MKKTSSEQAFLTERYEVGYYCSGETVRPQSCFQFDCCEAKIKGPGFIFLVK